MNILVTGGAGFIGSHLCTELLKQGNQVVCLDNFELGSRENLMDILDNSQFTLIDEDASNISVLDSLLDKMQIEMVFHLAANSDIQKSAVSPEIDFRNTFSTSYSVLEAMRRNRVKKLFFASTSAVYGEKTNIKLSEDMGALSPISYYGGAKLASEAFISSYAYMNDFDVTIFRFPNVIGPRLTHGVIFDFIRKLKKDHTRLQILGDGKQKKPYLYVFDLIDAILKVSLSGDEGVNIYNIGVENATTVKEIADMVCEKMGYKGVRYLYTGGQCGWKGDVPQFQYDLSKIHQWGWQPSYTSNEAVMKTLDYVLKE
ncbi:MAG: NAD-dependent epimerase/dehydratase family protein [Hungatella sp.]|jgi:UDP-glucose 4-epimerase|nr:NAD-dependent epimerase/dehydratase family protein [Hungatella sp.]